MTCFYRAHTYNSRLVHNPLENPTSFQLISRETANVAASTCSKRPKSKQFPFRSWKWKHPPKAGRDCRKSGINYEPEGGCNDALARLLCSSARCSRFINNAVQRHTRSHSAKIVFVSEAIAAVESGGGQVSISRRAHALARSQSGRLAGCRPPTHALHLQSGGGVGPRKPLPSTARIGNLHQQPRPLISRSLLRHKR